MSALLMLRVQSVSSVLLLPLLNCIIQSIVWKEVTIVKLQIGHWRSFVSTVKPSFYGIRFQSSLMGSSTAHTSDSRFGRSKRSTWQHLKPKPANSIASSTGQSPADTSNTDSKFPLSRAHFTSLTTAIARLAIKSRKITIPNE
ncbi:Sec14p-like phosphatidylinositol transfer family protein [Striga asiatica]|uniref:Sec14p-like phosphatidylinositol transfer family protein n=1 Tax=Striga asiatica TaxID=4170 RepID=A0A5A7R2P6_STRAF|nr:Sec14p-like phosphatidylinositol transfer family protein [Striga asiatica]